MPTNLTDDPSSFPTQTAPVSGEPRTAASVATPFQNAANRAGWCKDRIEFIDPDKSGARRLRRFASIADMQAAIDFPDGTFAYVDGLGLYQMMLASTLPASSPFVVVPTSVGGGAGRWVLEGLGALNIANGIPQLDGTGKVPGAVLAICNANGRVTPENVVRGVVEHLIQDSTIAAFTVVADTTWRDTGAQLTTSATTKAGDLIEIDFLASVAVVTPDEALIRIAIVLPDSTVQTFTSSSWSGPFAPQLPLMRNFTAPKDGSYTAKLQARGSNSNGNTATVSNFNGRLNVYRP